LIGKWYNSILSEEWEIPKEIVYYNTLPDKFDGFAEFPNSVAGILPWDIKLRHEWAH